MAEGVSCALPRARRLEQCVLLLNDVLQFRPVYAGLLCHVRRRPIVIGMAATVAVLLAGGGTAFALSRHGGGPDSGVAACRTIAGWSEDSNVSDRQVRSLPIQRWPVQRMLRRRCVCSSSGVLERDHSISLRRCGWAELVGVLMLLACRAGDRLSSARRGNLPIVNECGSVALSHPVLSPPQILLWTLRHSTHRTPLGRRGIAPGDTEGFVRFWTA